MSTVHGYRGPYCLLDLPDPAGGPDREVGLLAGRNYRLDPDDPGVARLIGSGRLGAPHAGADEPVEPRAVAPKPMAAPDRDLMTDMLTLMRDGPAHPDAIAELRQAGRVAEAAPAATAPEKPAKRPVKEG